MKILFLHPNFPAQFKNVVKYFTSIGHECIFLCQTHYGRNIANVEKICLKGELGDVYLQNKANSIFDKTQIRAAQYRRAFSILIDKNWNPDLVISHTGWGCGIHLRELWPSTKIISYLEWWYDPNSEFFKGLKISKYFNISPDSISKFNLRNQPVAIELLQSDFIVTPSEYQFKQLPALFQDSTEVIFDGIDLNVFTTGIKSKYPKITFGTRGMEPLRGFPQFIKEIPLIRQKFPHILIEIAGSDQSFYFSNEPDGFSSWKQWAIYYLSENSAEDSVVWKGVMNLNDYSNWLKSSWLHVYLSEAFIPSWSMVESISVCSNVFLSDNPMTREFTLDGRTQLVDHNEEGFLSGNRVLFEILNGKHEGCPMYSGAILNYRKKYSMDESLQKWHRFIT